MIGNRLRKSVGCLVLVIAIISFLFLLQATDQHGGASQLFFPTVLQSVQGSLKAYHQPHNQQQQQPQQQQQQPPLKSHSTPVLRQKLPPSFLSPHHLPLPSNYDPNPKCQFAQNIAFIKTHKAGSSTIANILQRFGLAHNLTFALPNKPIGSFGANYLVRAGEKLTREKLLPLKKGESEYNILWCHSIYDKDSFHAIMPNNTVYVSILREPFQQFVSSFEYYGIAKTVAKMNINLDVNSKSLISTFLQSPELARFRPQRYGYLRNKQSEDLGFGREEFYRPDKMKIYIETLDADFTSVMIMEFFDESLILLRHKLCWQIKDILYIPKNKNKHKPNRVLTDWDTVIHKSYSMLDYNLYNYFLHKLRSEIDSQPVAFIEEIVYFKDLLKRVADNCPNLKPFVVPSSKWNSEFPVSVEDCRRMKMSELEGLMMLRNRYFKS